MTCFELSQCLIEAAIAYINVAYTNKLLHQLSLTLVGQAQSGGSFSEANLTVDQGYLHLRGEAST